MNAATLSIFRHLFPSVAEEMGATLEKAGYSANIKERLDFSCALFLADSQLLAQAAHIPVHLGAMPASVKAAIQNCSPFNPGDVVILNDPYSGGTHLPDVTLVSPVYIDARKETSEEQRNGNEGLYNPQFFVASRAHHADIGGMSPGSMPLSSELFQEGLIIPPVKLIGAHQRNDAVWQLILGNVRTPVEREGDLAAQLAAHHVGTERLKEITARYGLSECQQHADELIAYTNKLTREAIGRMPDGRYSYSDFLDNDGLSSQPVSIQITIEIDGDEMLFDFSGTDPAVGGNLNAVPAIADSAVAYCIRCLSIALLEVDLPMNQGMFEPWSIVIEPGSLLDPHLPHAVAAGNVETSQRIVDVVFGALAKALPDIVPAASQGTMNNLAFGSRSISGSKNQSPDSKSGNNSKSFAYYETIGGGIGANQWENGDDGMHAHMSNTRNTPVEALEYQFPLSVSEYSIRTGSGGDGLRRGGNGLRRTIKFNVPVTATIISERRNYSPYGLNDGESGLCGRNGLKSEGEYRSVPGKAKLDLKAGDVLSIETPGGGGWGNK
jgi:N-methylhydantoinase B